MAKLVYAALTSLDGFIEDADGRFEWAVPDAEVHAFINELEAGIGTHLYGRRMYEAMEVWQTVGDGPDVDEAEAAYAVLWRALDKVVYSRTLDDVRTARTRLEREFDASAVARLKASVDHDLSVSGPDLARHAFAAGLVGDGKPGLPRGVWLDLELAAERRFASGVVHLHHRVRASR
jgi:dihydrofolate reductase